MGVFTQRLGLLWKSIISGASDPFWNHVQLLLGYEGSTLADESIGERALAFVGVTDFSTTEKAFGAQSVYSPSGGTDRVEVELAGELNFEKNAWTIETWFWPTGANAYGLIMGRWISPDKSWGLWTNGNLLRLSVSTNGTTSIWPCNVTAPGGWKQQWYFIAADYDGVDTHRVYLYDPVLEQTEMASSVLARDLFPSTGPVTFFADPDNNNKQYGYLDETRITKGIARYDGTLVVPSEAFFRGPVQPTDPYWDNVTLLVGPNTSIIEDDSLVQANLTTFGSVLATDTEAAFGSGSIDLDGTDDAIDAVSVSEYHMGNEDFTVEFSMLNLGEPPTTATEFIGKYNSADNLRQWTVGYLTTLNYLYFYVSVNGTDFLTATFQLPDDGATPFDGTWHHVAAVRYNGVMTLYVDGIPGALTYAIGTDVLYDNDTVPLSIGARATASGHTGFSPCNLDEIRITKGVARYTGAFTPPTHAFPRGVIPPPPPVVEVPSLELYTIFGGSATTPLTHSLEVYTIFGRGDTTPTIYAVEMYTIVEV